MKFSQHDFIHPEDLKARQQLEAIPGLRILVKATMKFYNERIMHGLNMASKIRLSERQLPDIYRFLPEACGKLGISEPEFYLEMNPTPNAYTYGDTRIFVTVTSGLIEYLDDDEIQAVVAHECGHIACHHTLYGTMAQLLINYGTKAFGLVGTVVQPAIWALLYWYRRSEFSADRAASVVLGGPESIVETMIRLSGGPKSITGSVDIDLYTQQANEYKEFNDNSWWDGLLQGLQVMWMTHPLAAVRVREIRTWCQEERFRKMMKQVELSNDGTLCRQCGRPISKEWKFCRYCGVTLASDKSKNSQGEDKNE